MCGIAGFTLFAKAVSDPDTIIGRMMDRLAHRGPDAAGRWSAPDIVFGHRRLSIIDLETGDQPMHTADGRFHLVFNGEIYNYLELRTELLAHGWPLTTHSDTEVLLGILALHGPAGLARLNGMFAFALWDSAEQRLLLARDRIGEKPLYYAERAGDVVFASELPALLQHPAVPREIDPLSVAKFLTYGWVPAPHSIYKGLRKLPPGHFAELTRAGLRVQPYWDLPLADRPIQPCRADEAPARFLALLEDSVRMRLRSDVPVGLLLSGGLDSSAVCALAARHSGARLTAFTIGFDEATYDETRHARRVADHCGVDHVVECFTARRAAELAPSALRVAGEPFADASILPTMHLFGFVASRLKVVLGGDGGDELMAGYPAFQAHRLVDALSFLPMRWRDPLTRLAARVPISSSYASAGFLFEQFLRGAGIAPEIRFLLWLGCCGNTERAALMGPVSGLLDDEVYEDIHRHVQTSGLTDAFQRITYLAAKMYLQDGILVKVDRGSMAHGLEVRSPFLDHRLVEFAARLSPELKLKRFSTKHLIKRAVRGLIPEAVITRRKAGFMMPVAAWLRRDLRPLVEDYCSREALARSGYLDSVVARRLVEEHLSARRDHRRIVWALLAFQCWWLETQGR